MAYRNNASPVDANYRDTALLQETQKGGQALFRATEEALYVETRE